MPTMGGGCELMSWGSGATGGLSARAKLRRFLLEFRL